ncbi:MAG: S26 family signal peptidase [Acidobacteria bacterium]|nr:S26 family signal peptidase [Acidobacteriota bacterium]
MPALNLSSRAKVLVCASMIAGLGFAAARPQELFLYNPSDSIPKGFYIRDRSELVRGSVVSIGSIHAAPDYAAKRDFVDAGDRFLKRIAGMDGDTVCAEGRAISLNGAPIAERADVDAAGDPLPSWNGCVTLGQGQVFLLGDHPASFDGRYWGVSARADLGGPWRKFRGSGDLSSSPRR